MNSYSMVAEMGAGIDKRRLEVALARNGMNAADLARASGVDKGTLSKILSGEKHSTTATILLKLARSLHVTTDYLLGLTDTPESTTVMLGELLLELTSVARRLPNRRQRDLLLMARAYLSDSQERAVDADALIGELIALLEQYEGVEERDRLLQSLRISARNITPQTRVFLCLKLAFFN